MVILGADKSDFLTNQRTIYIILGHSEVILPIIIWGQRVPHYHYF